MKCQFFSANKFYFAFRQFYFPHFVERAERAFEGFLAHREAGGDFFRTAVVAEGQRAACGFQFVEEHVGEVAETPLSDARNRDVELLYVVIRYISILADRQLHF